eukprot:29896-Pelagococcus_subviridis.AAC.1
MHSWHRARRDDEARRGASAHRRRSRRPGRGRRVERGGRVVRLREGRDGAVEVEVRGVKRGSADLVGPRRGSRRRSRSVGAKNARDRSSDGTGGAGSRRGTGRTFDDAVAVYPP